MKKDSLLLSHFRNMHMNQKRALGSLLPSFHSQQEAFPFPSPFSETEAASKTTSSYTPGSDTVGRSWLSAEPLSRAFAAFILAAEAAAHPVLAAWTSKACLE